jgi:hypothetical protein
MGTAGKLQIHRPQSGCWCLSCDLCLAEEQAVLAELVAKIASNTNAQRERIIAEEARRFAAELPVY